MKYRLNPKNGDALSILGFGGMRLTKNEAEQQRQIAYAVENGVNFFDTAYIYQGSEVALGKALAQQGYRERVKISTKLPLFLVRKYDDLERLFTTQLQRLQTDRVDYYFMHMLNDTKVWGRLVDLGILKWLEEKKRQGRIINIGFSYHGGKTEFTSLVDAYDWDFCMIQYNFLDEQRQAGRSGLEYAAAQGLPVFVMEPLRGGKLVSNLPKEVYALWKNAAVQRTPAEWALRFVWDHPGVTLALSGMNSLEMIEENIAVASVAEANSLTEQDYALFARVRDILEKSIAIPCTSCNYCMPCPQGVDIPTCFSCYNDQAVEGKIGARQKYLMQTSMKTQSSNASRCVNCGKCEQHCPQKIAISAELTKVARALEGFYYRPLGYVLKKFMHL